jgi:tetratricopeptide (TPR) repeat protein
MSKICLAMKIKTVGARYLEILNKKSIYLMDFLDILGSSGLKGKVRNLMTSLKAPEALTEDDYVKHCLECEFLHEKEERTSRSNSVISSVLTPLDLGEYSRTIIAGRQILPQFADFDLLYIWIWRAYRATKQYQDAKTILSEGLSKSKRKTLLLTSMGETELDLGNIEAAVYWWSQALAGLSLNPISSYAFMFLSYVAKGVGYEGLSQRLLNRSDIIFGERMRLDSEMASRIIALVSKDKKGAIAEVLLGLSKIYFF